jgi:hypothetical protein
MGEEKRRLGCVLEETYGNTNCLAEHERDDYRTQARKVLEYLERKNILNE